MLNYPNLESASLAAGFTHMVPLKVSTIELLPEVRQMCEANTCRQYAANWSCPPACGTLEECRERVAHYQEGILVQTVGQLEDEMDGEGMMDTEARHKQHFRELYQQLRAQYPDMLAIGSGCCRHCPTCTYPDAPCRFPAQQISSMEAYGMLVVNICKDNGLTYYYGPCTIAYTSCFLLK